VARTATLALTNATLPYIAQLASQGSRETLLSNEDFRAGLNIYDGQLTHQAVAEALSMSWRRPEDVLNPTVQLKSA
ncbi:MAG: alanine dehydrogenase, partial [Halieaceae bacterium]